MTEEPQDLSVREAENYKLSHDGYKQPDTVVAEGSQAGKPAKSKGSAE